MTVFFRYFLVISSKKVPYLALYRGNTILNGPFFQLKLLVVDVFPKNVDILHKTVRSRDFS